MIVRDNRTLSSVKTRMLMSWRGGAGILWLALFLLSSGEAFSQTGKTYLEYEDFRAWVSLVPEVEGARLCNLTHAGHELWAAGQLRMPAIAVLHGDLGRSGRAD